MKKFDLVIVGAGIVGLATAYQVLKGNPKLKLCIVEKEDIVAKHQTGNNSGVIHSGIYYKPNSRKAINCKLGYKLLLDFCNDEDIPYELCGKIIVATSKDEIPLLDDIYNRGVLNGLEGLKILDSNGIKEIEPFVNGVKGIFVPQAGIIDYKEVSNKLLECIKDMGGEIIYKFKVDNLNKSKNEVIVKSGRNEIKAKLMVNCGGLFSDKLASLSKKINDIKIIPFRGEYYELKPEKRSLVNGLVYPVPNPNFPFLGVHFTKMISGGVEAGPNAVFAFKREGYKKSDFNLKEFFESITFIGFQKIILKYWKEGLYELYRSYSKKAFVRALQKLIPSVRDIDIIKGGAGVRAQACLKSGVLVDDFLILEDEKVINVCNAPSPAATSSLSIGLDISNKIISKLNKYDNK